MTTYPSLQARLEELFSMRLEVSGNFARMLDRTAHKQQQQTNDVFSEKWSSYDTSPEKERLYQFQLQWYLKLYGFADEAALRAFLAKRSVILDAGCGLGYKAAWFARLAPHALVVGMDFSAAAAQAAATYRGIPNLVFIQGDIAATGIKNGAVDYVSCDQVIMHTQSPEATFRELVRICEASAGEVACYFYAKKALPRELLDDHFRIACTTLSSEQLWALSEQMTTLGRRLSELKVEFDAPDIPLLGIKGGRIDIQRFIYWNFAKCFWNPELGEETSRATNFDWYSPSNARRFSREEVLAIVESNGMRPVTFHAEEACYSGRFQHVQPR